MTERPDKEKPRLPHPALILCGGRSQRMGSDKALLPLGSKTVLQRVVRNFSELSDSLVLVIGHQAETPPDNGGFTEVIRDEHPDFGPLEGLRVGLQHLQQHDFVMVGTCDAPLVVADVYRSMVQRMVDSNAEVALPMVDDQYYPLTAVYRTSVLGKVSRMVANQQLRVKDLLSQVQVCEVSSNDLRRVDPELQTLRNINTRAEYQQMLKDVEQAN